MSDSGFPQFRPPLWMKSGHTQTVIGAYLPSKYTHTVKPVKHVVRLDDGDHIICHDDCPEGWQPGDRVAVLIHGLCGSSTSGYVVRVAAKLNQRGVRTLRKTLRGFGDGVPYAKRACHAGQSEDVAAVIDYAVELCPDSPITLVGFSLGANMVVKLLGEFEDLGPRALDSAIAAAPPIDLVHCCEHLRKGLNRFYDWSFVRSLHSLVQQRRRIVPDLHDVPIRSLPRRLREFDHAYTAPLIGCSGVMDYYEKASSAPYLARIRRPTLIITAADDPIIPVDMFSRYQMSPQVKLHVTEHGGHLGWVGVAGIDPDRRWLDWRIVDWIEKLGYPVRPACRAGRRGQEAASSDVPVATLNGNAANGHRLEGAALQLRR